jgi:tetratricopeptide (TPR) repeat protein
MLLAESFLASNAIAGYPAAFVPPDDNTVIATLPLKPLRLAEQARQARQAQPGKNSSVMALLEEFRETRDLRLIGRAKSALGEKWTAAEVDSQTHMIRAYIYQHEHNFDIALKELDALLRVNTAYGDGHLLKASILQIQGHYRLAQEECRRIQGAQDAVLGETCGLWQGSMSGDLENSFRSLQKLQRQYPGKTKEAESYRLGALADMASRSGEVKLAIEYLQGALELQPLNTSLRSRLIDELINTSKYAEALTFTTKNDDDDSDLVHRAVILKHQTGHVPAELTEIFLEHQRLVDIGAQTVELDRAAASFYLYVMEQPTAAHRFALKNWTKQREPIDTRLLATTSRAVKDDKALQKIREFIEEVGFQDAQIGDLRIGESP